MRIGVTGATGKYGSEVIKHLLKNVDDNQIVAFARNPKKPWWQITQALL